MEKLGHRWTDFHEIRYLNISETPAKNLQVILQSEKNANFYEDLFTCVIRGVADKSLARPTSRCVKKESIVSLERGLCSCA